MKEIDFLDEEVMNCIYRDRTDGFIQGRTSS